MRFRRKRGKVRQVRKYLEKRRAEEQPLFEWERRQLQACKILGQVISLHENVQDWLFEDVHRNGISGPSLVVKVKGGDVPCMTIGPSQANETEAPYLVFSRKGKSKLWKVVIAGNVDGERGEFELVSRPIRGQVPIALLTHRILSEPTKARIQEWFAKYQ